MNQPNLYWPVYKNLEKIFLQLADYIHFADDQVKVYSMHIADLIVRCSIEIEAIAKELYLNLGGNPSPIDCDGNTRDLYFDTDCLTLLENNWHLSKKQLAVSATTFYFSDKMYKVIAPLYKANKRGTSGSKWKQAYQAVKHNRKASLKMANIENLLYAMGALFILNLYYKDEVVSLGRVYMSSTEFESRAGSDIFSIFPYYATSLTMANIMDDSCIQPRNSDLGKSIYIIRYDEKSFRKMHESYCKDYEITMRNFIDSPQINKFLKECPEYENESLNKTCLDAGGIDLFKKIFCFSHTRSDRDLKTEAIVNKHSTIYPTLSAIETANDK